MHLRLSFSACPVIPWFMNAFMIPRIPMAMPGNCTRASEIIPSLVILRWADLWITDLLVEAVDLLKVLTPFTLLVPNIDGICRVFGFYGNFMV